MLIDKERRPTIIILYGKDGLEGKGEFFKNLTRLFPDFFE